MIAALPALCVCARECVHGCVFCTVSLCGESPFCWLNMWIFKNDNSQHSCTSSAGLFLRDPPSCSSCIQHHAPCCRRRLQRHWRGLHVICRIWYFPINTEHSARSMYQKDGPRGLRNVWLSISSALPCLARPFASVWLCRLWRSGLGWLCCDHLWRNWWRSEYTCNQICPYQICSIGKQETVVGKAKEKAKLRDILSPVPSQHLTGNVKMSPCFVETPYMASFKYEVACLALFVSHFFFFSPCRYEASCRAYFCCLLSLRAEKMGSLPWALHLYLQRKETDRCHLHYSKFGLDVPLVEDGRTMSENTFSTAPDWCYPTCALSRAVHSCRDAHRQT